MLLYLNRTAGANCASALLANYAVSVPTAEKIEGMQVIIDEGHSLKYDQLFHATKIWSAVLLQKSPF